MATWKENGVVPDSDDEEDLESQSVSSFEDPDGDNQNILLPGDNEPSINRSCRTGGTGGDGDNGAEIISQQVAIDEAKSETTTTHIRCHPSAPDSSPISRRPFKFPQSLSDSEDELAPSLPEQRARGEQFEASTSKTGMLRDDISKTYVRLTSPLSSLDSSILDVAHSIASPEPLMNVEDGPKSPILTEARHTTEDPVPEIGQESDYAANGRSLRRRNPIQLHPYIVEQEKYRRSLKARGMTPMRIQTQDEARRRPQSEESQDPDSQDFEPQDMDVEPESQPMDFDWASVPPSSEPKAVIIDASSTRNNESSLEIDEEVDEEENHDELPATDEMLRGKQSAIRYRPRPRLKSYSLKKKHALQPKLQSQSDPKPRSQSMNGMFEIPVSPPTTSSPFPNLGSTSRGPISRAISISSNERTPSRLDQDELESPYHADLPTPATSATKPTNVTALPNSDSDGADPFASEPDPALSYDSSSNESVQIRKIRRKFRGVLPASHLRLDQQRQQPIAQPIALREGFSALPAKRQDRRGVALLKAPHINKGPEGLILSGIPFLSDESEESDNQFGNGFIVEEETGIEMGSLPKRSHLGLATEDDRIDHMLPAQKRKARISSGKSRKKRRVSSGLSFRGGSSIPLLQPKITDHLTENQHSAPYSEARRLKTNAKQNHAQKSKRRPRIDPPRLSILDVTDSVGQTRRDMPQFVRLAARSARSRKGHGRQSPSKKFIRLANREDTYDAQSTLRDWRDGKIKPKDLISTVKDKEISRPALQQVPGNYQTRLPPPIAKAITRLEDRRPGYHPLSRKLVISRSKQRFMNDFVDADSHITPKAAEHPKSGAPIHIRRRHEVPQSGSATGRPAQLESLESTYSQRYPVDAFKTSKKALDALYRTTAKRLIQPVPLQLSRFLADDDAVHPSIESTETVDVMDLDASFVDPMPTGKRPRCKKRPPNRIDTGAAVYRQPSEPLVLELLSPPQTHTRLDQDNRLLGLGKLGTNYPCNFGILPLRSGIFFHRSTLIGSGLLSKSLKIPEDLESMSRSSTSLRLGDKEFEWGPWKDSVSSEVGVCFDWLLEQLTISTLTTSNLSPPDVIRVIMFIVEYVQHHLTFTTSQDRTDFLLRMLDILQDFLSNFNAVEDPPDETKIRYSVEVLVRCTVLSMQLLQISKVPSSIPSITYQLESLLLSVARHCVRLLLSLGLDSIRKLYDDLQYLSVRENGIKSDRYAVQAWVIIIKVLEAAKIPRGSFWDVTNSQLMVINVRLITDARIMEKTWYSMFSLLPLCEFDEFGVVIPGSRQSAAFDNWSLPQQLLKRIFELYSLNARQSPSFNDYCRVIVSRCLHLMVEWGWWKCGSIIGNLFDFFASRNLEHLRNEEVYKSPRFLDELTTDPTLTLEVEDCCFHVFLKIVALAIKRMCLKGDIKGVRNLIPRLLPNHDRQYPKEETILHRELASLRNHHDLLCTLYWAAPRDQRPSLSLIQELVIPDRSHNEACSISLRAWARLASFVLASSPTPEAYEPLLLWQTLFFTKLLNQYLETNSEVQQQAELLTRQGVQSISEIDLQSTITLNKRSTMSSLKTAVASMRYNMNSTTSSEAAKLAFNHDIISAILSPVRCGDFGCDTDIIQNAVTATLEYIDGIEKYEPYVPPGSHLEENDSQEYGSIDELGNWGRQEMIKPLSFAILDGICGMLRNILEYRLYQSEPPPFMESLVRLWAILASLVTEDSENGPVVFLVSGPKAVFEHRKKFDRATIYWPLFLGVLLKRRGSIRRCDLDSSSFDLTLEWMLAVSMPESLSPYSMFLTKQIEPKKLGRQAEVVPTSFSADTLLKDFFRFMRDSSKDISRPDLKELQPRYSSMLKELMTSMKGHLEKMTCLSPAHKKYVVFVQRIATLLRSEVSDICSRTDYFVRQSSHYWPPEDDPNLYVPGLMAYDQRLSDRPDSTPSQLFYYLYNGWKNAFICGRLTEHRNHVYKGMKGWNLTKFMLEEFVPVILYMGFDRRGAWVFSNTYLPIIARRVHILLNRRCDVLEALVNALRMSMNGILSTYLQHGRGIDGINPHHRGIISEVCNFWVALLPSMIECAKQYHGRLGHLDGVNEMVAVFNDMAEYALRSFDPKSEESWSAVSYSVTETVHFQQFKSAISDDMDSSWNVNQAGDIRIRGTGPQGSRYVTLGFDQIAGATLHDILRARLPTYDPRSHYSRRREQIQGACRLLRP
ncbi:hypothetical protein B7494_g2544 [Chlorociboria aeruginascens]|nr:hypothetical protein B7494_g2544 [Chlorociboria aeruginascens]